MGCVYSYPLFSFQGSIPLFQRRGLFYQTSFSLSSTFLRTFQLLFCFAALAATNDILSDSTLFVKYFFLYLSTLFVCRFLRQRMIPYHIIFISSSTIFHTFEAYSVCRFAATNDMIPDPFSFVNTKFHFFVFLQKKRYPAKG